MFDLESAVAEWKRALRRSPAFEDGQIAELEANLRDEVEELIGRGKSPEDAFAEALATAGRPNRLGAEYAKARSIRRSGRPSFEPPRFVPALAWSYVRIVLRKMRRQKGFSLINIAGLSIGMACCILILLWVGDERSYDRFHENGGPHLSRSQRRPGRRGRRLGYLQPGPGRRSAGSGLPGGREGDPRPERVVGLEPPSGRIPISRSQAGRRRYRILRCLCLPFPGRRSQDGLARTDFDRTDRKPGPENLRR